MFERETRREKILEARNKELRLKEKTKGILGLGATSGAVGLGSGPKAVAALSKGTGGGAAAAREARGSVSGAEGEGVGKADGAAGADKEEEQEDPIVKAEREFFQIIKQVTPLLRGLSEKRRRQKLSINLNVKDN